MNAPKKDVERNSGRLAVLKTIKPRNMEPTSLSTAM